MQFSVIQHREGKGWEMVPRANRKLIGTCDKLGLSAALLAGEVEGPMVQSTHFQTTHHESLKLFLDNPVRHFTVYFPVHYLPHLFAHFIYRLVCWVLQKTEESVGCKLCPLRVWNLLSMTILNDDKVPLSFAHLDK